MPNFNPTTDAPAAIAGAGGPALTGAAPVPRAPATGFADPVVVPTQLAGAPGVPTEAAPVAISLADPVPPEEEE